MLFRSTGRRARGWWGVDGVAAAVDQLAGAPVPASALESLVLASRVRDYEPSYLDELTATGEVVWAGHGTLPGSDGWVSLHLADTAALTLPPPTALDDLGEPARLILDALAPGGAFFFRQLAQQVQALGAERDSLKSRLAAARSRIDTLLDRLPA